MYIFAYLKYISFLVVFFVEQISWFWVLFLLWRTLVAPWFENLKMTVDIFLILSFDSKGFRYVFVSPLENDKDSEAV